MPAGDAPPTARSPSREFLAGVVAESPILIGAIPLGIAFGVAAVASQLGVAATAGLSSIVFAGSSQFVAAQMFAAGAPAILIVLTIFIVNLRHALYSASLAPHLAHVGPGWRALLSYLLTDEAYVVAAVHFERDPHNPLRHWFLFGAGFTLWAGWQVGTWIGAFAGAAIPPSWQLDFMLPLIFLGLVVPLLRHRPEVATAVVAAALAVAAAGLPFKLNLLVAICGGLAAGMFFRRFAR